MGLAAAIVIALNIKFTSTAYTLLLLAVLMTLGLWLRRSWRWALSVGAVVLFGFIFGLMVVGFNPYVTNLTRDGHPFFPLYGSEQFNKDFVMHSQMPRNFDGQSWGKKVFLSLFSQSQNTFQGETGPLKLPFTFTIDEIKQFVVSDVRIAGFGVLFSGIMLIAAIGLVFLLFADRRSGLISLSLLGLILLTMLINSEAWWARYAPQLWLAPIIVASGCLISKARWGVTWSGRILLVVLLLNITLISSVYLVGNLRNTMRMKHVINQLANSPAEVLVYYGPLRATELKLDEAGVKYQTVLSIEALPCPLPISPMVFYSLPDCGAKP